MEVLDGERRGEIDFCQFLLLLAAERSSHGGKGGGVLQGEGLVGTDGVSARGVSMECGLKLEKVGESPNPPQRTLGSPRRSFPSNSTHRHAPHTAPSPLHHYPTPC